MSCSLAALVAHVLAEQSPGNELHLSIRNKAGEILAQVFAFVWSSDAMGR